jgi:hypothetical protein
MNRLFVLYITSGCHLCEQAESLLQQQTGFLTFRTVEIADDAKLLERYGARIPVLQRLDTGDELDWPFDAKALQHLLTA